GRLEGRVGAEIIPEKPLLLFDGACGFCRRWVNRWKGWFGDRIEILPFQEAGNRFPEAEVERFAEAIHLVEPDGRISRGAEAVFRVRHLARGRSLPWWAYLHLPGFRPCAEACYSLVARHRIPISRLNRWVSGPSLEPPSWFLSRELFLRALGSIFLCAFLSLWVQIDGLIGEKGILPAAELMARAGDYFGSGGWLSFPTLLWFDASDFFLHTLCAGGSALSILLVFGFAQKAVLLLLWAFYLSLTLAGTVFLGYQWDALLLEAGLLAVFLAPGSFFPSQRRRSPPSGPALFLLRWLLFRLMFLSGTGKLLSGDPSWHDGAALGYHYWTQPLPSGTSFFFHHLPGWFHAFSVAAMFFIELVLPFFIFGTRRMKRIACAGFLLLQVMILASGNYGFFNLLTMVLCMPLLDDQALARILPGFLRSRLGRAAASPRRSGFSPGRLALVPVFLFFFPTSSLLLLRDLGWRGSAPAFVEQALEEAAPFRSINDYGLFRVMTKERPEIVVEGSRDGKTWEPYLFRWKPVSPGERPRFAGPHMPRLDWQMWFAALAGDWRRTRGQWFPRFLQRLLEGEPAVLALLRADPFPGSPPRFVRSRLYRYSFATREEHAREGVWWDRTFVGPFSPVLTLVDGQLVLAEPEVLPR
ncbi:MAG: lipase maturation factor family protein, partial [Planctomycetota bacterium]